MRRLLTFAVLSLVSLFAIHAHAEEVDFYEGIGIHNAQPVKFYGPQGAFSVAVFAPALASDLNFVLPATAGSNGQVLMTDGAGHTGWTDVKTQPARPCFKTTWTADQGLSIVIPHKLNTLDVMITEYDLGGAETIHVQEVRTDANSVTLTASETPSAAGWRVLVCGT